MKNWALALLLFACIPMFGAANNTVVGTGSGFGGMLYSSPFPAATATEVSQVITSGPSIIYGVVFAASVTSHLVVDCQPGSGSTTHAIGVFGSMATTQLPFGDGTATLSNMQIAYPPIYSATGWSCSAGSSLSSAATIMYSLGAPSGNGPGIQPVNAYIFPNAAVSTPPLVTVVKSGPGVVYQIGFDTTCYDNASGSTSPPQILAAVAAAGAVNSLTSYGNGVAFKTGITCANSKPGDASGAAQQMVIWK